MITITIQIINNLSLIINDLLFVYFYLFQQKDQNS